MTKKPPKTLVQNQKKIHFTSPVLHHYIHSEVNGKKGLETRERFMGPKNIDIWWFINGYRECNVQVHHDDVIKWKHFPRYWPFVWGIHRSPVNSPHKDQWRGPLIFSLICAWKKRLNEQSWSWWFETLSRPLWRQCNVEQSYIQITVVNIDTMKFHHNSVDFLQHIHCRNLLSPLNVLQKVDLVSLVHNQVCVTVWLRVPGVLFIKYILRYHSDIYYLI